MQDVGKEIFAAGAGCAMADSTFNGLEVLKVRAQITGKSFLEVWKSAESVGNVCLPGLARAWPWAGLESDPVTADAAHPLALTPEPDSGSLAHSTTLRTTTYSFLYIRPSRVAGVARDLYNSE